MKKPLNYEGRRVVEVESSSTRLVKQPVHPHGWSLARVDGAGLERRAATQRQLGADTVTNRRKPLGRPQPVPS